MKRVLNGILGAIFVLFLGVCVCISLGHTVRGKTSAEASDLSPDELVALKQKATQDGDQKSAARIYWYYRLTKRDYVEAKKWEYATLRPGETNSAYP